MAEFEAVVGRYLSLEIEGEQYRVYFEEAGEGIPLICQHTAGGDGRQYRHLLNDPEVTSRFRVIVHDLPYHGKSVPPVDVEWWKSEYRLTMSFFMNTLLALSEALELDEPVYLGCSMGGHMAGDLALHHPDRFRAVIGVEAAMQSHGVETLLPYLNHPRISHEFKPSLMYTLCAPQSPEVSRRETAWVYSQGAPAVFKGDLAYYVEEHDLTEDAAKIDTSKIDVHILGGQYDWSATPVASKELADAIEGATFTEMKELGHFGMSENYERFRQYLLPVLEQVESATATPA